MTGQLPKALCSGCGQLRHVTLAGLIRRHRDGQRGCAGAGQEPAGDVVAPVVAPASTDAPPVVPAPTEPTWGRSCDGGGCDAPSVGWRLFHGWRFWLPVCGLHMDGPAGRNRVFDRDLTGGEER